VQSLAVKYIVLKKTGKNNPCGDNKGGKELWY
jgi:hypothetical protein